MWIEEWYKETKCHASSVRLNAISNLKRYLLFNFEQGICNFINIAPKANNFNIITHEAEKKRSVMATKADAGS